MRMSRQAVCLPSVRLQRVVDGEDGYTNSFSLGKGRGKSFSHLSHFLTLRHTSLARRPKTPKTLTLCPRAQPDLPPSWKWNCNASIYNPAMHRIQAWRAHRRFVQLGRGWTGLLHEQDMPQRARGSVRFLTARQGMQTMKEYVCSAWEGGRGGVPFCSAAARTSSPTWPLARLSSNFSDCFVPQTRMKSRTSRPR